MTGERTIRLEAALAAEEAAAEREERAAIQAASAHERPTIDVGRDYTPVVNDMIAALAPLDVFQRGGGLVECVRDTGVSPDGVVRDSTPRLRFVPAPRLRQLADDAAEYVRRTPNGEPRRVRPPNQLVSMVAARGQWRDIRPLSGVVSYPVLRPDGSVLQRDGYDAHTGLFAKLPIGVRIPMQPSREDARCALAEIEQLVADFPFESEVARAAWIAALLTPLARPAIAGPVPMLLIDANARGAGKSLLADVLGAVVLGQRLPRRTAPSSEDEWRKAMLAIGIAADPVVLIDNVTRTLRAAALDAVLTGDAFRDRILGRNQELTLDVRTLFVATANNATVSADLVRRSLHCRLVAREEQPERRSGFSMSLPRDALLQRPRYLSAALTVLRGYFAAGSPVVELRAMGMYDEWSAVVRSALVWCGQPDPAFTQDGLRAVADLEREALSAVLLAWRGVYESRAVTTSQVLADVGGPDGCTPKFVPLRDAVAGWLDDRVTARRLGNRLRSVREQIVDGLVVTAGEDRKGYAEWRVTPC